VSDMSQQEISFYAMVYKAREETPCPESEATLWACEKIESLHQELMWVRASYRLAASGFLTTARLLEEERDDCT